ncbi:MAG: hypothetical protein R3F35_24590 [Myxococcota bacterium]
MTSNAGLRRVPRLLPAALLLSMASHLALASDGVLEIHQACVATGCVPGDAAGFPVTLTTSGSYRLTSNLTVPDANTTAIQLGPNADRSTIDLNGFAILGPTVCSTFTGSCAPIGTGHGIAADAGTTEVGVRNGRVVGMGDHGLFLQNRDYVFGVTAQSNGGIGIEVGAHSSVIDSQAITNGGTGIFVDENTSATVFNNARQSLIQGNLSVRNAIVTFGGRDIVGGRDTGGNVCSDGSCAEAGRRRYYLSLAIVGGGSAGTVCDPGFGVASVWELHDPSALRYDVDRGFTDNAGTGPPRPGLQGWAYMDSSLGNCSDWSASTGNGTYISLEENPALQEVGPWLIQVAGCSTTGARVWCIER